MISFSPSAADQMTAHAESIFPDECCGFLYGTEDPEGNRKISIISEVNNSKEGDKKRRFVISPKDYMQGEKFAIEHDTSLLGIYHSHPEHPGIPSEHDRVAAQPYFSYVIVSVMQGKTDHIRSWQLNEDSRFNEENFSIDPINKTVSWQP